MSRVHDALRRAEQSGALTPPAPRSNGDARTAAASPGPDAGLNLEGLLEQVQEVPFRTATDSLLIDVSRPHEAPMEEFRTLRTRLNHMKSLQPIHSVVVTSPSPAEGKSLSAVNLALAQAHLAGNTTLLADFDFRRPIIHTLFGVDRSPGITDYLLGKVPLHQAMRKIAGTNLYIMPAGEAVINPLELLNLDHPGQSAVVVRRRRQSFVHAVSRDFTDRAHRAHHHRLGDPRYAVPVQQQCGWHCGERSAARRAV
jgi:protein-tyrosine kinase